MMNFIFITSFIIPLLLFPVSVNSTKSPADVDSKVKAAEYGSSQIQDIEERLDNRTDDHGQVLAPVPASNWTNRRKAADSENVGDQWKPSLISSSSYGSGQIQDESKKTNPNPQTTGRTTKYSNSSISGTKSSGKSGRNAAYGSGEIQPSQKKGGKSVSVESVGGGDQVSDYDDLGGNNFGQTQNGRFGNNNGIGGLNGNNNNGRRSQGIGTDYGDYGGRQGNAGGNGRNGGGAGDYNDYGNGVNGNGRGGAVDPWGRGNNGGAVVPRSGNNFNNYGTDYGQGNAGGLTDYDQYDSGGGAAMPNVGSSLPRFLLLVSTSERQRFLQLEADQQRSKATIRLEKQRWANQQLEPRVQTLYAQFTRAQQQREQQFRQRRSQLLAQQRLSATALDVDRRIQAVLNNPDVSQRTAILQVDRIMQQTNPQTRLELQQRIGVIGPLDGNFPPSQMLPTN